MQADGAALAVHGFWFYNGDDERSADVRNLDQSVYIRTWHGHVFSFELFRFLYNISPSQIIIFILDKWNPPPLQS